MATLSLPPLLEPVPFYSIETPKPTLDHVPEQFDKTEFEELPSDSKSNAQSDSNQSDNNDTIPPTDAPTEDPTNYNKITKINTNWSAGIQAMHKSRNKLASANNNRIKAQHKRAASKLKPAPKCPYKLLDATETPKSYVKPQKCYNMN